MRKLNKHLLYTTVNSSVNYPFDIIELRSTFCNLSRQPKTKKCLAMETT